MSTAPAALRPGQSQHQANVSHCQKPGVPGTVSLALPFTATYGRFSPGRWRKQYRVIGLLGIK